MNHEIDVKAFEHSSGELSLLPVVAAAFLKQLPMWRVHFAAALELKEQSTLLDLLHKMRGACQAVAAVQAGEHIGQYESLIAHGDNLFARNLLARLEHIEAELLAIIDSVPKDSRGLLS